jgi:uncharacterized membrane protein
MSADNLFFSMEDFNNDPLTEKLMDKNNNVEHNIEHNVEHNVEHNIEHNVEHNIEHNVEDNNIQYVQHNSITINNNKKNRKRKITNISNEVRYENNIPIPFYESIEDEINDINKIFNNNTNLIKYPIKSMPIGAIFQYKNMVYKFIRYNNDTQNIVVQLLKDGILNDQKILSGQVIEIYGSKIGTRLFIKEIIN